MEANTLCVQKHAWGVMAGPSDACQVCTSVRCVFEINDFTVHLLLNTKHTECHSLRPERIRMISLFAAFKLTIYDVYLSPA